MKIVFATFGSLGDVHPFLALALEMQRRGHDVCFATSESYRAKIEATGLAFAPLRPDISPDDKELIATLMDADHGTEQLLRGLLFPAIRETYDDLCAATRDADLLVSGETIYAAPIVAAKKRLRWVSATLAPLSFFSVFDPPVLPLPPLLDKLRGWGPHANRQILRLARFRTRSWAQPALELRRELGLPRGRHPIFDEKCSPHRVLALFSKTLGAPQRDWPAKTLQTGFCFYDTHTDAKRNLIASQPAVQQFLDAGDNENDAPIVFTLGSAAVFNAGDFYEQSLQIATILGRRALLLTGENVLSELPPSMLAVDYAPYSLAFSRAAAIVHQGGVGTTAQAMRAGVPQLIMPFSHDQPDNAARIVKIGVGLSLARNKYSSKNAARSLKQLLETPSFAQRAQEIAAVIAQENGLTTACDELERELERAV